MPASPAPGDSCSWLRAGVGVAGEIARPTVAIRPKHRPAPSRCWAAPTKLAPPMMTARQVNVTNRKIGKNLSEQWGEEARSSPKQKPLAVGNVRKLLAVRGAPGRQ